MAKFKVIIKKEGKKRGVTKYVKAETIEEVEEYALDHVCKRYSVEFADFRKMGVEPKINYIIQNADHLVVEFFCEMGINPEVSFIDITSYEGNHRLDGGVAQLNF